MLKWGTDLADQLFLPSWVEASVPGAGLYAKYGYKKVAAEEHHSDVVMYREARPVVLEAAKKLEKVSAGDEKDLGTIS